MSVTHLQQPSTGVLPAVVVAGVATVSAAGAFLAKAAAFIGYNIAGGVALNWAIETFGSDAEAARQAEAPLSPMVRTAYSASIEGLAGAIDKSFTGQRRSLAYLAVSRTLEMVNDPSATHLVGLAAVRSLVEAFRQLAEKEAAATGVKPPDVKDPKLKAVPDGKGGYSVRSAASNWMPVALGVAVLGGALLLRSK